MWYDCDSCIYGGFDTYESINACMSCGDGCCYKATEE